MVASLSVVSNAALICFATNTFASDKLSPVWLFVILQWLGFGVMVFLSSAIPDETYGVRIQVRCILVCKVVRILVLMMTVFLVQNARNEFWNDKCIRQVEEEESDADGLPVVLVSFSTK